MNYRTNLWMNCEFVRQRRTILLYHTEILYIKKARLYYNDKFTLQDCSVNTGVNSVFCTKTELRAELW